MCKITAPYVHRFNISDLLPYLARTFLHKNIPKYYNTDNGTHNKSLAQCRISQKSIQDTIYLKRKELVAAKAITVMQSALKKWLCLLTVCTLGIKGHPYMMSVL